MAEPHAETAATVEHGAGGGEAHAAPSVAGITAPMFIGLAMLVVIVLMLWKKVPSAIGARTMCSSPKPENSPNFETLIVSVERVVSIGTP